MKLLKKIAEWILEDEFEKHDEEINEMGNKIAELTEINFDLEFENPLEDYYNNKYPKFPRAYNKKFLNKFINLDVRCFVGNYHNFRLPIFKGTDDENAIESLKWTIKNKKYRSDQLNSGLVEYWNFSYESKEKTYLDCEDGAILIYDILRANGIPAWRLRITAGWAINPWNGNIDGHAYLTYYSEFEKKWVALDWCYFPNTESMKTQPHYKDVSFYGDVWFSFNELHSWGKDKL